MRRIYGESFGAKPQGIAVEFPAQGRAIFRRSPLDRCRKLPLRRAPPLVAPRPISLDLINAVPIHLTGKSRIARAIYRRWDRFHELDPEVMLRCLPGSSWAARCWIGKRRPAAICCRPRSRRGPRRGRARRRAEAVGQEGVERSETHHFGTRGQSGICAPPIYEFTGASPGRDREHPTISSLRTITTLSTMSTTTQTWSGTIRTISRPLGRVLLRARSRSRAPRRSARSWLRVFENLTAGPSRLPPVFYVKRWNWRTQKCRGRGWCG